MEHNEADLKSEILQEMRQSEKKEDWRINTVLQSACTAMLVGISAFLWSMNARMAVAEERGRTQTEEVQKMRLDYNVLSLKVQDNSIKIAEIMSRVPPAH